MKYILVLNIFSEPDIRCLDKITMSKIFRNTEILLGQTNRSYFRARANYCYFNYI